MLFFLYQFFTALAVWPFPRSIQLGKESLIVNPTNFFKSVPPCTTLQLAIQWYSSLIFPHTIPPHSTNSSFLLQVKDLSENPPSLQTDESYILTVSVTGEVSLRSETIYGALHGLETLSQLITFDFDSQTYLLPAPVEINDGPRFPHRGLMLDLARHWLSLTTIKQIIDSLSFAKLNVLHLHLSDSQSFPMESSTAPRLWKGAFSLEERYTKEDMRGVVEYARSRGIRVIAEYDVPGHADSWCVGYPDICPSLNCTTPLNVANNKTFDLIEALLHEMKDVFTDDFMHLGGDEVHTGCWESTESISKWLMNNNLTADEAYGLFTHKVSEFALSFGKRPIQWCEVFDHFGSALPKETVVHIWKKATNVSQVVQAGYNILLDVDSGPRGWYLDHLQQKWSTIYKVEPCKGLSDVECKLVLGGQGQMWGETVDGSDLESTVWPRLASIGERLWSPREINDTNEAKPRLEEFRCLLLRRGVSAAPLNYPRQPPTGPGSCRQQ